MKADSKVFNEDEMVYALCRMMPRLFNFVVCYERGTETQAAQRLGVSVPNVNNMLLKLEKDVGGLLFYRSRRQLEPTELGTLLYHTLAGVVDAALDSLSDFAKLESVTKFNPIAVEANMTRLLPKEMMNDKSLRLKILGQGDVREAEVVSEE